MANLYNKAGLINIPVGYSDGFLYNIKPTDNTLGFKFDRASAATRVNEKGLIENVQANVPRIDYTDSLTSPSFLLEPQRTNIITYSEDLTEWTTTSLSVTSNNVLSPDGTQNADKVTATANFARIQYTYTLSASTTYNISFYVKNIDAVNPRVQVYDNDNSTNLLNTYYGSELTGEWKRLTYSFTTTTGTSILVRPIRDINDTEEMYLWGIQVEAGSYATSYIPTAGSTVTRAAETCNAAGNASTFNDSEGVLYAEIAALANDGTSRRLAVSDGTGNNRVEVLYGSTSDRIDFQVSAGGSFQGGGFGLTDATNFSKVAVKYKLNDLAFWINGFEVATDTSATMPSGLDTMRFEDGAGFNDFYGKVKSVAVFKEALTDEELQALTS